MEDYSGRFLFRTEAPIGTSYPADDVRYLTKGDDATLVSSLVTGSMHKPALDIDFPVQLVPSTTPGHFHLYLDKEITWRKYRRLLRALWRAGVIERGFYKMSVRRGASYLRRPGIKK